MNIVAEEGSGYWSLAVVIPWITVLSFIMGGCCSNAYALEQLITQAPKSGNLITFAQFLVVALEGLSQNLEVRDGVLGLKERKIPIRNWLVMVALFFSSSLLNNLAFGFHIPMVLHIIFRSSSLISNMILGILILKKRYNSQQYLAIAMVTVGVLITTLSTMKSDEKGVTSTFNQQLIGIGILTLALFLASYLGIVQEVTYKKYGKHWREGLFYTHLLSLPFFLIFFNDISEQLNLYLNSTNLPFLFLQIPGLVIFLITNVATQYFCVSGVQRLSSMTDALTLNLVLTIRKMVSIIFSVLYFKQPITYKFLIGTALAFTGTFLYSVASIPKKVEDKSDKPKEKPKD